MLFSPQIIAAVRIVCRKSQYSKMHVLFEEFAPTSISFERFTKPERAIGDGIPERDCFAWNPANRYYLHIRR
jgi:hypothetical protein